MKVLADLRDAFFVPVNAIVRSHKMHPSGAHVVHHKLVSAAMFFWNSEQVLRIGAGGDRRVTIRRHLPADVVLASVFPLVERQVRRVPL